MFQSTKLYGHEVGLSCAFRQWRAHSHCNKLHGYALSFKFTFEAEVQDRCGWVVDFGGLKSLKAILENAFDHKTLVAEDDPDLAWFETANALRVIDIHIVEATGCEAFAKMAFIVAENWLYDAGFAPRVWLKSVEVCEHAGNSAIYLGEKDGS